MHFFFLPIAAKKAKERSEEDLLVPLHQPPHSLTEGSEFLDDAIRAEEPPSFTTPTEESVAPGSPTNLF